MSKTIRIDEKTYNKIISIQTMLGLTKKDVVQKAVDQLNKDLFWAEVDEVFQKLKRNKKAWAQELAERKEWGC